MSDALSTLLKEQATLVKAQAQPKMQRINFAVESAELDSPGATSENLINLFAEAAPPNARSPIILRSSPGLTAVQTLGTGPVYAANGDLPGRIYVVSGTHFYRITPDGPPDDLGDVGSITASFAGAMPTIAVGVNTVVVCIPPNAYASDVNGTVLRRITGSVDNPYPGASSVAYVDGYFVFTADENSSRWFITPLFDPNTFNGLDFAYADAVPNVIRRVVTHRGELWFCGEAGLEVWYNSGDLDFPFRRRDGGSIPFGCLSPRSVAIGDNSVFWVGMDRMVYRADGYRATRVSTHSIENAIQRYLPNALPVLGLADALTYSDSGHIFYALSLVKSGDPGVTLVHDAATKLWHKRSSDPNLNGRWTAKCTARAGNLIFGDHQNGNLYTIDQDGGEEAQFSYPRQAVSVPIWAGTRRAFMPRLEIEMEALNVSGPHGNLSLEWSDDGGVTWKGPRLLLATGKRIVTDRLGSFRQRMFRLTAYGRIRIYAVDAFVESGDV